MTRTCGLRDRRCWRGRAARSPAAGAAGRRRTLCASAPIPTTCRSRTRAARDSRTSSRSCSRAIAARRLEYTWWAQRRGFVRNTLERRRLRRGDGRAGRVRAGADDAARTTDRATCSCRGATARLDLALARRSAAAAAAHRRADDRRRFHQHAAGARAQQPRHRRATSSATRCTATTRSRTRSRGSSRRSSAATWTSPSSGARRPGYFARAAAGAARARAGVRRTRDSPSLPFAFDIAMARAPRRRRRCAPSWTTSSCGARGDIDARPATTTACRASRTSDMPCDRVATTRRVTRAATTAGGVPLRWPACAARMAAADASARARRYQELPAAANRRDRRPRRRSSSPAAPQPQAAGAEPVPGQRLGHGRRQAALRRLQLRGVPRVNGGGAIGPPLMDDKWIYGAQPDQIYATISQGRPDGMPSFGGHVPTQQIWQLVAYVRVDGGPGRRRPRRRAATTIRLAAPARDRGSRRSSPCRRGTGDAAHPVGAPSGGHRRRRASSHLWWAACSGSARSSGRSSRWRAAIAIAPRPPRRVDGDRAAGWHATSAIAAASRVVDADRHARRERRSPAARSTRCRTPDALPRPGHRQPVVVGRPVPRTTTRRCSVTTANEMHIPGRPAGRARLLVERRHPQLLGAEPARQDRPDPGRD